MECARDEFLRSRCEEWLIDSAEKVVKDVRDANQ